MEEYQCVVCKSKPLARYMTICEDCRLLTIVSGSKIKQLEAENDKLKQVIKFEISQPFIRSEQEERLQKALKGE